MKLPGAADAVAASMRAISEAVSTEGAAAVQAAQRIAERIKELFSFTATPTISPQFAPSGGGGVGNIPPAPLPPRKPKVSDAGGRVHVAQTIHLHGVQDAAALHRELARAENRAVRAARNGALFDTGAIA